jgi:transposase-like protein
MHISSKEEFLGLYEDVEYIGNDLYSVSKFNLSEAFKKPRESPSDRLERMEKEAMMKIEYGNILDKIDYTISENHYRVIDGSGNKITPYIYNKISKFSNGLSLVAIKKEKTDNPYDIYSGFINTKGNVVIPLKNEYRSLGFYDGLALDVENSYQKNISFIDTTGKIAFQLNNEYQWLDDEDKYQYTNYTNYFLNFEDNILIVKNIKNQKKICIINKSGLVKTCGDWVSITKFHNKMSLVKNSNGKYAIIDTNGKYIVQPKYDFIFAFGNDYLSEKLFLNPYTKFYEKEIQENEPTGFDLSRYNYTFIKKFNMNDLFLVRKNNSIFYVDSMGFEYIEK